MGISAPNSFLSAIGKARRLESCSQMLRHRIMSANRVIAFSALRPLVQAQHGRSFAKSGCLIERAFHVEATCPTNFVLAGGRLLPQATLSVFNVEELQDSCVSDSKYIITLLSFGLNSSDLKSSACSIV
jgi:hypothetical protein